MIDPRFLERSKRQAEAEIRPPHRRRSPLRRRQGRRTARPAPENPRSHQGTNPRGNRRALIRGASLDPHRGCGCSLRGCTGSRAVRKRRCATGFDSTSNAQRPTPKERIPTLEVGRRALGVGRLRRRHLDGSTATKPGTGVPTQQDAFFPRPPTSGTSSQIHILRSSHIFTACVRMT